MFAEFTQAIAGTNKAMGFVKAFIDARDDKLTTEKLSPVLLELSELKLSLMQAKTEMMALEAKNQELENQLQKKEDWKAEKAKYKQEYFPTGQMAYTPKEPPENQTQPVYFCLNCMDNDDRTSQLTHTGGMLRCGHCDTWFLYKPPLSRVKKIRGGVDSQSW